MAIVTGLTAAKMLEIANASIVSGAVNIAGRLILRTRGGVQIDAGPVVDPTLPGTIAQYFRGDRTWQELNKTAVGLENVDNTTDLNKPLSNAAEKLGKGLVYKNFVTTTSGAVVDAVVNNIPSFTFKANRNYRIEWDFTYYGTGNSDSLIFCTINSAVVGAAGGLTSGLTVLNARTKSLVVPATNGTQHTGAIVALYNPGAADVTRQIKFRAQTVAGDDGIVIVGSVSEKAHYLIYDEGSLV